MLTGIGRSDGLGFKAVDAGFVNERNQRIICEATDVEAAIDALKNYQACEGRFDLQWIDKEV